MDDEIEAGLRTLGYSRKWVDYGFLDAETLRRQIMIFDTGEDRNTEHYRYGAFCAILDRPSLTDDEVKHFVELAVIDDDEAMSVTSLMHLIRWSGLTDTQQDMLRAMPELQTGRFLREFEIRDVAKQLNTSSIASELFDKCLAIGEGWLLQHVADHPGATDEQLTILVHRGKSKAVRNTAASALRRRAERVE